ncbi:NADH:flavin oxidoreductase [Neoasaia chiangmaiensis NBRC 101099]|uniref:Alkene reductase n=1 Tax=Neoasaia chiangmaiensis TaxID=320497 RepID=A0A1U9KTG5_9PROT|nr:alkene reductase [Neoasaia chiangmaiensis]AQS89134.1 alkene reductase [Neoasaia chiangmaiensis]GBR37093.1 NADH:flavin oxidoreductase [Neoasaia chiangmaiensis NBRC 101099]GEN16515.1 alkene reductase [Neoasaia chiangmaiensis]
MYEKLFSPLHVGRYELAHRVVMAPLTRMRAGPGNVPNELAPEYYGQRASKDGLIIAEATQVTPYGQGYPQTPGIYSEEQVAGWRRVTDAVHAKGGLIFLQLWHVGRSSHSSLLPGHVLPVAPSAIAISKGSALTPDWKKVPFETPHALTLDEIPGIIEAYRDGARKAQEAGFDGVEIHAANGYLLEQFLHSRSNHRTDIYGGSIENRARLLLEVTQAAIDVWGKDRVGVRMSPFGTYNDVGDSDPIALYSYVLSRLSDLDIAYAHLIEARDGDSMEIEAPGSVDELRPFWKNPLFLAGGFTGETGEQALEAGRADAIAFGRLFIANPDLPERLRLGGPLNHYDRATFYGGGAAGYVDYPFLNETRENT